MTPTDPYAPTDRPRAQRPLQDAPEPQDALPALPGVVTAPPAPPRRRFRPAIETVLLASTAALLAAVAWPIATAGLGAPPPEAPTTTATETVAPAAVVPAQPATIQIALLLDTSSSMDGLIDQARSQLWRVVNALDSATFHGAAPRLELALYEYGNDDLERSDGFIRQVSGFTVELDRVSEALFALDTLGGDEHAGQAIARSIDELSWNDGPGTLKVLYIAGNESFAQGPVDWNDAIERARAKGVVVNTVLCNGVDDHWSDAAKAAGGKFMKIDHDAVVEYIAAPQDDEIAKLGLAINGTSVPYGAQGRWGMDNQLEQDGNAEGYGAASSVQRAMTKGSRNYVNPTWDLVDAADGKGFSFESVARDTLPAELTSKSAAELKAYVDAKRAERSKLKDKLSTLAKAREAFVTAERIRRNGDDPERLDTAIVKSIVEQAEAAGFTIGEEG
ncbi:MAG: VWA domain-containing protein [Myxococcota bacterium]